MMEERPKREKSRIELEFEERMERRKQAVKAYRSSLEMEPDAETRDALERIRVEYPDRTAAADYAFYKNIMDDIYGRITECLGGYGQCRGNLVTDGHHIIMCCCEQLRACIGKGRASVSGNTLTVNRTVTEESDGEGGTYRIRESSLSERTDHCPFCKARLKNYEFMGIEDE